MDSQPQPKSFQPEDLHLYVYGSRESDQFWLPEGRSHSRKPFCLTTLDQFTFDEDDEELDPIPNPLFKDTVLQIACGGLHSIVLTTDGRVFTMGCNDEGALGRKGMECIPIQVKLEDPIDMVSAGDNHSLFVNSVNGAIYFTGNYNYKRGQKMTESIFEPVRTYASEISQANKNKPIQKIDCGANHSVILVNNKVYCRGEPEASTTGRRVSRRHTVENSLTFNGVSISHVEDIVCGGYHTIVKCRRAGKISYHAWGTNSMGQLGIGSFDDQAYPVEITKLRNKDIVKMAAGAYFSLFLTAEGEVYGCGCNDDCNLGLGKDYSYESSNEDEDGQEEDKPANLISVEQSNNDNIQQSNKDNNMSQVNKDPVSQVNKDHNMSQVNKDHNMSQERPPTPNPISDANMESQKVVQPQISHLSQVEEKPKFAVDKQANLYIKSIRKIQNMPEPVRSISCGENFSFAWSSKKLYTWGFGTSYVLLNGTEEEEEVPFGVKDKILNNHRIHDMQAGGQHVMYLSYSEAINEDTVKVQAKPSVWENLTSNKRSKRR